MALHKRIRGRSNGLPRDRRHFKLDCRGIEMNNVKLRFLTGLPYRAPLILFGPQ